MKTPSTSVEVIKLGILGDAVAMNSDHGIIHKLGGKKTITRATEILHYQDTDKWYVAPMLYDSNNVGTPVAYSDLAPPLKGFAGYGVAVAFEVVWVKMCYLLGRDYANDDYVCSALRHVHDYLYEALTADKLSINSQSWIDESVLKFETYLIEEGYIVGTLAELNTELLDNIRSLILEHISKLVSK